jgi:membrane associated rhomboid family serine protease
MDNDDAASLQTVVVASSSSLSSHHRPPPPTERGTATNSSDTVGDHNWLLWEATVNDISLVDIPFADDDEEHGQESVGHSFLHPDFDDDDDSGRTVLAMKDHHHHSPKIPPTTNPAGDLDRSLIDESVADIVDGVLYSLQRARYARQQNDLVTSSTDRGAVTTTSHINNNSNEEDHDLSILVKNATSLERLEELKTTLQRTFTEDTEDGTIEATTSYVEGTGSSSSSSNKPSNRHELRRRVQTFYCARLLRREQQRNISFSYYGMDGLFQYLQHVQVDLEWAEDASWRRLQGKEYLSWSDYTTIHGVLTRRNTTTTWFVYCFMLVFTGMLIFTFHENDWNFVPLSVNPFVGPGPNVLLRLGALHREATLQDDEYYRLVTCIALHAGVIHYAINIMAVLYIGGIVERVYGTLTTTLVFVITAIGGNLASVIFLPESHMSMGASSGIVGLLGLYLSNIVVNYDLLTLQSSPNNAIATPQSVPPWFSAAFWFFVTLAFIIVLGLTPYVDQFAHITSLFLGFGLCISFVPWLMGPGFFGPATRRKKRICALTRLLCFAVSLSLLGVLVVWLIVLIYSGGYDGKEVLFCDTCHYLSCVPFPFWEDSPWWQCDACDLAIGYIENNVPTTVIALKCPSSGTDNNSTTTTLTKVDLLEPNVDSHEIQRNMSQYCRQYCFA